MVSTSCPGRLRPACEVPRCRPPLPGESRSGPRAHNVNQLSRVTCAPVPGPAGLTSNPRRLGTVPWSHRVDQHNQVTRAPGPRDCGIDQMCRATWARVPGPAGSTSTPGRLTLVSKGPRCPPALPGNSRLGRWPALSSSCPGRLGPTPEVLRAQPDVPCDLEPCSSACGVDQ